MPLITKKWPCKAISKPSYYMICPQNAHQTYYLCQDVFVHFSHSKFSEHCWCSDNWILIHLASLKSDILLPLHRRMFGQVIWDTPLKLKSKSNKDESNYFEWLCTHVPFSCFLSGFYRAYDTIVIAVIVRSCLSCDDHYHQSGNQALTR